MRALAIISALTCVALPVAAQDLTYDFAVTEACLAETPAPEMRKCIGAAAEQCMEQNEGGYSTVGMVQCLDLEVQDWDRRLNAVYKILMKRHKATDAEMAELGATVPSQAEALRDMQRAWITFRDASCAYERAFWGNGTGAGPAGVSCYLYHTAEQAWALESDASGWEVATCNHKGCTK